MNWYRVRPPRSLSNSFSTWPSATASTGVPAGAMMSSASCTRLSLRASLQGSSSCAAAMPCTGSSRLPGAAAAEDALPAPVARTTGGASTGPPASESSDCGRVGVGVALTSLRSAGGGGSAAGDGAAPVATGAGAKSRPSRDIA